MAYLISCRKNCHSRLPINRHLTKRDDKTKDIKSNQRQELSTLRWLQVTPYMNGNQKVCRAGCTVGQKLASARWRKLAEMRAHLTSEFQCYFTAWWATIFGRFLLQPVNFPQKPLTHLRDSNTGQKSQLWRSKIIATGENFLPLCNIKTNWSASTQTHEPIVRNV